MQEGLSSRSVADDVRGGRVEHIATRACKRAETCIQDADLLC